MSRRAPSRPGIRTLVRTSQRHRFEQSSLCRAYELALPVVAQALAQPRSAKSFSTTKRRHVA
jgi:hypothetical protein